MSETRLAGLTSGDEKHEAHSGDNPAPERNMSRDCINIGYNIFQEGLKYYKSQESKDLLNWLWSYAIDELENSKMALCDAVAMDWKDIHAAFTGSMPEESLSEIVDAARRLKKAELANGKKIVQTSVTKRISEALDYCRDMRAMITVKGPTGRSKTSTVKHWARMNNHGRTRYIRMPSSCSRRMLVSAICGAFGIGVCGVKTGLLEERLLKACKPHNVIIIDEAGHLMPRLGQGTGAIEFVRDLHDICGCGIALIFTDVYLQEMRNGRLAAYFEQFVGRIKFEVSIPQEVRKDEALAVVKSFTKTPSEKLLALALRLARDREGALRTLFEDMERAKDWAESKGRKLEAEDLKTASDWRKSGGYWPEEA